MAQQMLNPAHNVWSEAFKEALIEFIKVNVVTKAAKIRQCFGLDGASKREDVPTDMSDIDAFATRTFFSELDAMP